MQMTITEALAEVKTIGKRMQKKKEFMSAYIMRQEMVKDPLEKDGGSVKVLAATLQAIGDLNERLIRIRHAVQQVNLTTMISIGDQQRSVTDWLTWRKDVAPGVQQMIAAMRQQIEQYRVQARTKGVAVGVASPDMRPTDIIVNVDEGQLARWAEALEETLGALDGKLSLTNATTMIEVVD